MPKQNNTPAKKPASTDLVRYQDHIRERLKALTPVFAKAVVGDFSGQVPLSEEDELTEFFVGVQIILDTIREKVGELEASVDNLHAANNIIASEKVRVEAILHGLGEGLLTVDHTWHVNYINEPAVGLLGEDARILGRHITDVLQLEDTNGKLIPAARHPVRRVISKRKQLAVDMTKGAALYVRQPEDGRRRIALTVTPIFRDEEIIGAAVVLRDITEESNIDWAKSEIVSIASHQLRTPLTAIKWYVGALLRDDSQLDAARTEKYLNQIYDANQHMIELVDALLNVSRIDLGTLSLTPSSVDLEKTLRSVLKELVLEITNKELDVQVEIPPNVEPLFADPNGVHIILQNVLSNAIKYSKKNGRVDVVAQQLAGQVKLAIKDNGCGIPADQQDKIFSKLFRASNASRVATDGSGLGLYVTKALTQQSGGSIWFESVEGQGTTFYVIIPTKRD